MRSELQGLKDGLKAKSHSALLRWAATLGEMALLDLEAIITTKDYKFYADPKDISIWIDINMRHEPANVLAQLSGPSSPLLRSDIVRCFGIEACNAYMDVYVPGVGVPAEELGPLLIKMVNP